MPAISTRPGGCARPSTPRSRRSRRRPATTSKRLFLFELLLFAGDLERARRQIEAIEYKDVDLDAAVGELPQADRLRAGAARPVRPRAWRRGSSASRRSTCSSGSRRSSRLRDGRPAEAAEALGRANEAIPAFTGRLNGQPFQSLRDADDLFAGVLEVMAHGRYFWVGLEQVRLLTMNPPRFPRDLLFVPAHLELEDEQGDVFLPALYPGSHEHADDQVKLGRMTDWKELEGGADAGRRPAHVPPRRRRHQPARMAGMAVGSANRRRERVGGPRRPWPGSHRRKGSGRRSSTGSSTPNRRGRAGVGGTASSR